MPVVPVGLIVEIDFLGNNMNNQDELHLFCELSKNNKLTDIKNLNIKFVRSQNYISEYREGATGRQISAYEMATKYGDKIYDIISEIYDYGSAILQISKDEPAMSLKNAREALGLSIEQVANKLNLSIDSIEDAENCKTKTSFTTLSKIAHTYGISDFDISTKALSKSYTYLTNLKSFSKDVALNSDVICEISTAIWIAKTQKELEDYLNIKHNFNYNRIDEELENIDNNKKPYEQGYYFADVTREMLGLPLEKIKLLNIFESLGIPVIQTDLSEAIAGVTICTNDAKAVVINSDKYHNGVSKRMTLAHELCHVLWDRKVDYQIDLKSQIDNDKDISIEQRANAFAIQFLAPIDKVYSKDTFVTPEEIADRFGISTHSANLHMKNFSLRSCQQVDTQSVDYMKFDEKIVNSLSIRSVPEARRGVFLKRVIEAMNNNMILPSTAAAYLYCNESDIDTIKNELY